MRLFTTLLITVGLLSACSVGASGERGPNKNLVAERVIIEPLGGFVGSGSPGNRFRSEGRMNLSELSEADRVRVQALFSSRATHAQTNLSYRITLEGPNGKKTIQVPDSVVPEALVRSIRTTLD